MSAGLIDRIRSLIETLLPAARAAKIDNADVTTSSRASPADVENRVVTALNAAVPPGPTADSLFERIKSLDDNLTAARAALIDVATSTRATPADVETKLTAYLNAAIAASPVANSVWERIKTLDDNYTAARAAYLDIINTALDVTVGSRAPASTALSNATWTNARAALVDKLDALVSSRASAADYTAARAVKLDSLDAAISSRASPSSQMTGIIKSIQRGVINIAVSQTVGNATISAVVTGKAMLMFLGTGAGDADGNASPSLLAGTCYLELTSTTNVRATRKAPYGYINVGYQVVEFY